MPPHPIAPIAATLITFGDQAGRHYDFRTEDRRDGKAARNQDIDCRDQRNQSHRLYCCHCFRAPIGRFCAEDIVRRRDFIGSRPYPLGGFPMVCRVASDDMSNGRERKMIAYDPDTIGRDAIRIALRDLIACAGS